MSVLPCGSRTGPPHPQKTVPDVNLIDLDIRAKQLGYQPQNRAGLAEIAEDNLICRYRHRTAAIGSGGAAVPASCSEYVSGSLSDIHIVF